MEFWLKSGEAKSVPLKCNYVKFQLSSSFSKVSPFGRQLIDMKEGGRLTQRTVQFPPRDRHAHSRVLFSANLEMRRHGVGTVIWAGQGIEMFSHWLHPYSYLDIYWRFTFQGLLRDIRYAVELDPDAILWASPWAGPAGYAPKNSSVADRTWWSRRMKVPANRTEPCWERASAIGGLSFCPAPLLLSVHVLRN